jgi:hypothetical protein
LQLKSMDFIFSKSVQQRAVNLKHLVSMEL